jgi:hypothetical protein
LDSVKSSHLRSHQEPRHTSYTRVARAASQTTAAIDVGVSASPRARRRSSRAAAALPARDPVRTASTAIAGPTVTVWLAMLGRPLSMAPPTTQRGAPPRARVHATPPLAIEGLFACAVSAAAGAARLFGASARADGGATAARRRSTRRPVPSANATHTMAPAQVSARLRAARCVCVLCGASRQQAALRPWCASVACPVDKLQQEVACVCGGDRHRTHRRRVRWRRHRGYTCRGDVCIGEHHCEDGHVDGTQHVACCPLLHVGHHATHRHEHVKALSGTVPSHRARAGPDQHPCAAWDQISTRAQRGTRSAPMRSHADGVEPR